MKQLYALPLLLSLCCNFSVAAEFNPGVAISSAGRIADPNESTFVASYISPNQSIESTVPALTKSLLDAAEKKSSLAIIGPNYKLNALTLKTALEKLPDQSLDGATILYVGDGSEDTTSLGISALMKGAILRSTVYAEK